MSDHRISLDEKAYAWNGPTGVMRSIFGFDLPTSGSARWVLYSGLYMFGWGLLLAVMLSDLLTIYADVTGLPADYWALVLAGPTVFIGAGVWWILIERRQAYRYRLGGLFGLLTASLTVFLWTARLVTVWGVEMLAVPMVYLLAGLVLGLAGLAGLIAGITFMYTRRRFGPPPESVDSA